MFKIYTDEELIAAHKFYMLAPIHNAQAIRMVARIENELFARRVMRQAEYITAEPKELKVTLPTKQGAKDFCYPDFTDMDSDG